MKVGIDIGGSHIAVALVDEEGKIVQKVEKDIDKKDNIEDIVNYVNNALQIFSKTVDISYVGIAAPGNPNGAIITNLVNLGVDRLDFHEIEDQYHVKIKSSNDAKAAGLAEKKYGAMRQFKDAVFLCLGTGIGGAVFMNDVLLQANRHPGFELGHMIIEKDGIPCNCGKKGCFEAYCSMKRFKNNVAQILKENQMLDGQALKEGQTLKESQKLDSQVLKEKQISIEDSIAIVQALKKNMDHKEVIDLVDQYINNLVVGLSNVIDIFEPEVIVLGGSFVYFKDIFYQKLMDTMEERRYVFNKDCLPEIRLATFQNDAGLIGATLL